MRYLYTLFSTLGLLAFSCAIQAAELRGSPDELRNYLHPKKPVVTLYAEAEEKAFTDRAVVSLVVTTEEKTLSGSLEKNHQLRQGLIAELVAAGISASEINNAKFSSSPQYGWVGKKPSAYEVVNRVVIKIDSEQQLKAIATQVDAHSEFALSSTVFEHSKEQAFKQAVKEKALDKVLQQKVAYEQKLGLKLVAVHFREGEVRPMATLAAVSPKLMSRRAEVEQDAEAYISASQEAPATSFDEVKYRASMMVDFEVSH